MIFAPLALIFTQTSLLGLALYTAVVEAILAMLLIVLIDVFGWHRNDESQSSQAEWEAARRKDEQRDIYESLPQ